MRVAASRQGAAGEASSGDFAQRSREVGGGGSNRPFDLLGQGALDRVQSLADQVLSRAVLLEGAQGGLGPFDLDLGPGASLVGPLQRLAGHLDALGVAATATAPAHLLQALGGLGPLGLRLDQAPLGTGSAA